MYRGTFIFIFLICLLFFLVPASSKSIFSGTWCIGDERLVITFKGSDTINFYSLRDEAISGDGTYIITDSTLTAIVQNDDLELRMGYKYKKRNNASLRAKFLFFTVDGDSVDHPKRWMRMEQCNPDTLSAEDTSDKEK